MQYHQKAFQGTQRFLKGNLHTHTTRSDGKDKPAAVIAQYIKNNYDFLAITDHNFYNFEAFGQQGITIIPGMEIDRNLQTNLGVKTFHTVCIGSEKGNGFEQDEKFLQGGTYFEALGQYQKTLDEVHKKNNLTIYCHPEWSRTAARDFEDLTGNFAMEIWNSGCAQENDCDTNAPYWDELLLQGKKIFGVATDDGHRAENNCCGWIMVKSEKGVENILEALKRGAFYSSCGPVIKDFYIEGDQVFIECSPCQYAGFVFGNVPNRLTHAEKELVEGTSHPIPKKSTYVRGVVKDEKGCMAWTNPIFLDEVNR